MLKEKELRLYGDYRTERLVLEAWKRMETDGTFAGLEPAQKPHAGDFPASVELPSLDRIGDH